MKIAVASKNPCKVNAAKRAFEKFFEEVEAIACEAESNVSEQPVDDEIFQGAKNRVKTLAQKIEADFYVGIEAEAMQTCYGVCTITVACIYDHKKFYFGIGPGFYLPDKIAKRLLNGEELVKIAEEITGRKEIRKKEGMIGHITNCAVTREEFKLFCCINGSGFVLWREKTKNIVVSQGKV